MALPSLLSRDALDVRHLPRLLEQRLVGIVKAHGWEKRLSRRGIYPVRLLACRRLGAEVDVYRAIGIPLHCLIVGIERDHRSFTDERGGMHVVHDHGPVLLSRNVGRNLDRVGMLAAQPLLSRNVKRYTRLSPVLFGMAKAA